MSVPRTQQSASDDCIYHLLSAHTVTRAFMGGISLVEIHQMVIWYVGSSVGKSSTGRYCLWGKFTGAEPTVEEGWFSVHSLKNVKPYSFNVDIEC